MNEQHLADRRRRLGNENVDAMLREFKQWPFMTVDGLRAAYLCGELTIAEFDAYVGHAVAREVLA